MSTKKKDVVEGIDGKEYKVAGDYHSSTGNNMKSRSQIRRFRSQMECKHDFIEREVAVSADGMCPICMKKRIEQLEEKLARHDKSKYTMINNQQLKQMNEKIEVLEAEKQAYLSHIRWLVEVDKEKLTFSKLSEHFGDEELKELKLERQDNSIDPIMAEY